MSSVFIGSPDIQRMPFLIQSAELIANNTQHLVAPQSGFIRAIYINTQKAVTTGGSVLVEAIPAVWNSEAGLDTSSFAGNISGDTLIPGSGSLGAVAGAAITVPNSLAAGTVQNAKATVGDPSTLVVKGQDVQLVLSGFATAGELTGFIEFSTESLSHMA